MKTMKNLFGILLLSFFMLSLSSCSNDDGININELSGTWQIKNNDPNFTEDGFVQYSFNTQNEYSIYVYDIFSDRDTTIYGTYELAADQHTIMLSEIVAYPRRQFNIIKLTSKEMVWNNDFPYESATPFTLNFVKVK